MTSLSIVIPALNEADGIADIANRVMGIRAALVAAGVPTLELIVVDDGSTDDTAAIAEGVAGVTVIRHGRNQGYGAAIKTGFRAAKGDMLAFLDADGTYPPEAFPELCRSLAAQGADIVVGSRMAGEESGMPLVRRLGNSFFARLVSLTSGQKISDSASGQRVLRREVLARVYPLPDGLNFTPVMTTRAIHEGLRMVEMPIRYEERVGRSKLSVIHDGRRFLTTILWTAMGYNPGRVLALAGVLLAGLGTLSGIGLVAMRLGGITQLSPWGVAAAFAALIGGVAGTSLVNLGITFNYLVSLFHRIPVQQGLFGRPIIPRFDRHFGWLGLIVGGVGLLMGAAALGLGFGGWEIQRLWLWLLGAALFQLTGLQMILSWILVRVLEELSMREARTATEIG